MTHDKASRLAELETARKRFGHLIQAYEKDFGTNSYLNRAPVIRSVRQLEGARLLADRYVLLDLLPKAGRVAEVGVDRGHFSRQILDRCAPRELFLIDIDLSRLDPENAAVLRQQTQVHIVEGRSEQVLASLSGPFSWIYIDGDHSYDQVCADIAAAAPLIEAGGYLVFNDYTLWSPANMMNYGVSRAVNEFLNANDDWDVAYFALQGGGYHDFALKRRAG